MLFKLKKLNNISLLQKKAWFELRYEVYKKNYTSINNSIKKIIRSALLNY